MNAEKLRRWPRKQNNRVAILGVSENRWTGSGSLILADGTTIIYSGQNDGQHQGGGALMLSRLSAKALLEWRPVSERIARARFYSKYSKENSFRVTGTKASS